MSAHTAGPWEWFEDGYGRRRLQTPDRGRLIVMDFVRSGTQGATPRFAKMDDDQPRGRRGGILCAVDPWTHPDGRLMAAAPAYALAWSMLSYDAREQILEDLPAWVRESISKTEGR